MAARRALHFVFKVGDRGRTARFYRELLGMSVSGGARVPGPEGKGMGKGMGMWSWSPTSGAETPGLPRLGVAAAGGRWLLRPPCPRGRSSGPAAIAASGPAGTGEGKGEGVSCVLTALPGSRPSGAEARGVRGGLQSHLQRVSSARVPSPGRCFS